ncbi:substrate-binding domain-containing protein, partial [Streptomyces sp. TRM76130]|nr:substrate-binding domain-containing protein [Streptomyces sp. TRM76130]
MRRPTAVRRPGAVPRPGAVRRLAAWLAAAALALPAAACTTASDGAGAGVSTPGVPGPAEPGTLRVLASSELADMAPVLERVREDTGVTVRLTPTGTLDAVDLLAKGETDGQYDAVWLSSNDYLRLRPEAARQVVSETPVMTSPVAIGVRDATVE